MNFDSRAIAAHPEWRAVFENGNILQNMVNFLRPISQFEAWFEQHRLHKIEAGCTNQI